MKTPKKPLGITQRTKIQRFELPLFFFQKEHHSTVPLMRVWIGLNSLLRQPKWKESQSEGEENTEQESYNDGK